MKISIITPSFNCVKFLERTLESIHSQTGDFELEHIVYDGASTDGTVEILERWKDKLDYVSEPDRGQSHALNKGFAKATGDVAAWLNADDLYLPGALAKVAKTFSDHPETLWAYGKCLIMDENENEIRKPITWYKNTLLTRYSYTKLLFENYISQPSTFFSKKLLDRVGPLNEELHYAMDYDLWLRFGLLSAPVVVPEYLSAFRFYTDSKTGGSFEDSLVEANLQSVKYSQMAGKPWIGKVNYWMYYKRTALIYKLWEKLF